MPHSYNTRSITTLDSIIDDYPLMFDVINRYSLVGSHRYTDIREAREWIAQNDETFLRVINYFDGHVGENLLCLGCGVNNNTYFILSDHNRRWFCLCQVCLDDFFPTRRSTFLCSTCGYVVTPNRTTLMTCPGCHLMVCNECTNQHQTRHAIGLHPVTFEGLFGSSRNEEEHEQLMEQLRSQAERVVDRRDFYRNVRAKNVVSEDEIESDNRMVGVEIEVVDKETDYEAAKEKRRNLNKMLYESVEKNLPTDWRLGIKSDSSVINKADLEGFEIITPPIPAFSDEFESMMGGISSALRRCGFGVNKTCGLHTHVDIRDFRQSPRELSKLLKTIYAIEDIIFSMNPPSRWNNKYCQTLAENYDFETFDNDLSIEDFENVWYQCGEYRNANLTRGQVASFKSSKYGHAKYSGINFHSTFYRGTIEFRYHAGTTSTEKIVNWARFLNHLVHYSVSGDYNDQDIKDLYEMPTNQKKLAAMNDVFSFSSDLYEYMRGRVSKWNHKFNNYNKRIKEKQVARKEEDQRIQRLRNQEPEEPEEESPRHTWMSISDSLDW